MFHNFVYHKYNLNILTFFSKQKDNHLDLIINILNQYKNYYKQSDYQLAINECFVYLCLNQNISLLQIEFFYKQYILDITYELFQKQAKLYSQKHSNYIDLLLLDNSTKECIPPIHNLSILQFLYRNLIDVKHNFYNLCYTNKLVILQWIYNLNNTLFTKKKIHRIFYNACREGYYDIVEWLFTIQSTILSTNDEFYDFQLACVNGHIDIAKLLVLHNPIIKQSQINDIFIDVCENGYLNVAQWLFEVNSTIRILHSHDSSFQLACENGRLDVAQWLLEINPSMNVYDGRSFAFRMACGNGHLDVAKWLFEINPLMNISEMNNYAFINACENGYLNVAKWLFEINPTIHITDSCYQFLFHKICTNGHLHIMQWLYQTMKNSNKYIEWNYLLHIAFMESHADFAKWLLSIQLKKFSINKRRDTEIFLTICQVGNLDTLRLFLSIKPHLLKNVTNISACCSSNINIAQWLFKIKPNISITNQSIKNNKNNNQHVIEWLQTIKVIIPQYKIVHYCNYNSKLTHYILYEIISLYLIPFPIK